LIANNPDESQQYMFAEIAIDLGLTADQVRSAFSYVGHSGMTIHVTDRTAWRWPPQVKIMTTMLVDIRRRASDVYGSVCHWSYGLAFSLEPRLMDQ
jgi:hypothetical protein